MKRNTTAFFGLFVFNITNDPMTMFLFRVVCVDSSSAARTHSAQSTDIYTGGTHETPEFNDHQNDDIIRYNTPWNSIMNARFNELMFANELFD